MKWSKIRRGSIATGFSQINDARSNTCHPSGGASWVYQKTGSGIWLKPIESMTMYPLWMTDCLWKSMR
jgi:hypothetical protein